MGEMKKFGRVINHYEQDRNWLKFCEHQDSSDTSENIIIDTRESYFKKIFNFANNITGLNSLTGKFGKKI